ncbi:MAG: hypothetical protein JKY54_07745 [Flavobacteriales bacterium]|nr:hypothetical protein [Flavobacteriales bacterium]
MFKINITANSLQAKDSEDISFPEAIQSIYDYSAKIYLNWNDIDVPISLKMDISDSWNDLLKMIECLGGEFDEYKMEWPSQSFFAVWDIKKINDTEIIIAPHWSDKPNTDLTVNKNLFITEWENVVSSVRNDLKMQGYLPDELLNR